jgi:hypothetical protein
MRTLARSSIAYGNSSASRSRSNTVGTPRDHRHAGAASRCRASASSFNSVIVSIRRSASMWGRALRTRASRAVWASSTGRPTNSSDAAPKMRVAPGLRRPRDTTIAEARRRGVRDATASAPAVRPAGAGGGTGGAQATWICVVACAPPVPPPARARRAPDAHPSRAHGLIGVRLRSAPRLRAFAMMVSRALRPSHPGEFFIPRGERSSCRTPVSHRSRNYPHRLSKQQVAITKRHRREAGTRLVACRHRRWCDR